MMPEKSNSYDSDLRYFHEMINEFKIAHINFDENLQETLKLVENTLKILKKSANSHDESIELSEDIEWWIEKYKAKNESNFDDSKCEEIAKEIKMTLTDITAELDNILELIYEAIEGIENIKILENIFNENGKEYIEYVNKN